MPEGHYSKAEIKAKFIEKNPEQTLLEDENPTRIDIDDIVDNDNYEVWIVQCPANINTEELRHQSIKLPGKTRINDIETIAEEFSTLKTITLGYKSADKFSVGTFPALGRILIREKLKVIRNDVIEGGEEEEQNNTSISHVPLPEHLKTRHPLLGADFQDKLILDEKVAFRLRYCDEVMEEGPIRIKQEIKIEPEEDNVEVKRKTKHKRKNIESPEHQIRSKKAKKKHIESVGDESSLAWIKNL